MQNTLEKPDDIVLAPPPEPIVNIYSPKSPFTSKLLSKEKIVHRSSPTYCWHLTLDLKGSGLEGKYRVGQSIGVVPDGRFGNPDFNHVHWELDRKIRLYSIASPSWGDDWKGETLSICVKRELSEDEDTGELAFGAASNFICDATPGTPMKITGPVGKSFLLPEDFQNHNFVFMATGTGVSPYRGMIMELFNRGFQGQVWLFYGIPYSTNLMYDDIFRHFADRHENFHYVKAISREQKNPHGGKMYVQDRLEEHQDVLVPLLEKKETLLYMCGLKGMEHGIYPWLFRTHSNLVSLPEGMTIEEIEQLPRDADEWKPVEKARDRDRLLKETY